MKNLLKTTSIFTAVVVLMTAAMISPIFALSTKTYMLSSWAEEFAEKKVSVKVTNVIAEKIIKTGLEEVPFVNVELNSKITFDFNNYGVNVSEVPVEAMDRKSGGFIKNANNIEGWDHGLSGMDIGKESNLIYLMEDSETGKIIEVEEDPYDGFGERKAGYTIEITKPGIYLLSTNTEAMVGVYSIVLEVVAPSAKAKNLKPVTINKKTAVYDNVAKTYFVPADSAAKHIKATFKTSKGIHTISLGKSTMTFKTGEKTAKLDGKEIKLTTVNSKLIKGKLYIPVNLLEHFGFKPVVK